MVDTKRFMPECGFGKKVALSVVSEEQMHSRIDVFDITKGRYAVGGIEQEKIGELRIGHTEEADQGQQINKVGKDGEVIGPMCQVGWTDRSDV